MSKRGPPQDGRDWRPAARARSEGPRAQRGDRAQASRGCCRRENLIRATPVQGGSRVIPGERIARDPGSSDFRQTPLGSRLRGNDDRYVIPGERVARGPGSSDFRQTPLGSRLRGTDDRYVIPGEDPPDGAQ